MRLKKRNRILIAFLKLNLLRNKFGLLTEQIKANVKGKLNSSFPEGHFRVPRFSYLFCRDRSQFGEGYDYLCKWPYLV